jgi:predicted outer membrane repeat protein
VKEKQMKINSRILVVVWVLCLVLALAGQFGLRTEVVRAETGSPVANFQVTNNNDNGPGSLREAIIDANANPGMDLISMSANGTLQLLNPLPTITDPVTILGPLSGPFAIDGNHSFRVLDIAAVEVTLSDLIVQNGFVTGASANGAGIRAGGSLTLHNVTISNNMAQSHGGGLYTTGNLTITNGIFQNNSSTNGTGGGIRASGIVSITGTQFVGNSSQGDGGGAFILGELTLTNGFFQENYCTATSCDGGALFSFSQTNIHDTQFMSNTAQDQGGGVASPGTLSITGSLFQNNQAVFGTGGGLLAQGQVTIQTTQFLNNMARSFGGGMYSFATNNLTDVLFRNNLSTNATGGGLYAGGNINLNRAQFIRNTAREGGGLYHDLGDGYLVNTLFAQNNASDELGMAMLLASEGMIEVAHLTIAGLESGGGSAIEVVAGRLEITNTIVTSHAVGISNTNASVQQDFNLFFGNATDIQGGMSGGTNSLSGDPLFVDPAQDDYHITERSLAIDMGMDAGVRADFDGDTRPSGEGFDIGFDEVIQSPLPPLDISFYFPLVIH